MAYNLSAWRLNVRHFHPMGLSCYGNDKKYIFMIWAHSCLHTFIFKDFRSAIRNNVAATKTHRFVLDGILVNSQNSCIRDIVIGTQESVVITDQGEALHFTSSKHLKIVSYLTGVRSICVTENGFAMICVSNGGQMLSIRLHSESFFDDSTMPKMDKQFDISFERKFCESTWCDVHFKIKELKPDEKSTRFFQSLRRQPAEIYTQNDGFLFFTLNNAFLTLILNADDVDDYRVNHIQTCTSNIINFGQSNDQQAIYLILESGVIEVLYMCNLMHTVMKRCQLFLSDCVIAGEINGNTLVYSDGFKLFLTQISYCMEDDTYRLNFNKTVDIFGVTALTFVIELKMCIAVTENCLFYKVPLSDDDDDEASDGFLIDVMDEVNDDFIKKAKLAQTNIISLCENYNMVQREITDQARQFQLLSALTHYRNYAGYEMNPFRAKLTAHKFCPDICASKLHSGDQKLLINENTYIIHIRIEPKSGQTKNDLKLFNFATENWDLTVNEATIQGNALSGRNIRIIENIFMTPVDIAIHLQSKPNLLQLSSFTIDLNTCVAVGQACIYISFPVDVDPVDFSNLWKVHLERPFNFPLTLLTTVERRSEDKRLIYDMKLPDTATVMQFMSLFPSLSSIPLNLDQSTCVIYMEILNHLIEVSFNADSSALLFKTGDVEALYFAKDLVISKLQQTYGGSSKPPASSNLKEIHNAIIYSRHIDRHPDLTYNDKVDEYVKFVGKVRQSIIGFDMPL